MGKIASKMLQFSSKQGEDMKMDVDIITNNKHGTFRFLVVVHKV
jgi:hypothetical protein